MWHSMCIRWAKSIKENNTHLNHWRYCSNLAWQKGFSIAKIKLLVENPPAHFSVYVKQQLLNFCFPLHIWIHNVTFSYIFMNIKLWNDKTMNNWKFKICRFKTYHLLTTLLCCFTNALLPKAVKNKKMEVKKIFWNSDMQGIS